MERGCGGGHRWRARTCLVAALVVTLHGGIFSLGAAEDPTLIAGCPALWRRKLELAEARRGYRAVENARLHQLKKAVLMLEKFYNPIEPEWVCESEERVGGRLVELGGLTHYVPVGDGPKFVCGLDALRTPCTVFSIGSNNDWSFEFAMHARTGCRIHTFDHTLAGRLNFTGWHVTRFHPLGLGASTNRTQKLISFEDMVARYGPESRRVDVLKIDCEGCEWQVLPDIFDAIAAGRVQVGQLQIELHYRNNTHMSRNRLAALFAAADRAEMRVFHKEANVWGCLRGGCAEFAFVHERSAACDAFISTHCPGASAQDVCGTAPVRTLT